MTDKDRQQLLDLRGAIDAELNGEPTQIWNGTHWVDTNYPIWMNSYRAKPKQPVKVFKVAKAYFENEQHAQQAAKSCESDLITLTETSRESFRKEPMRVNLAVNEISGSMYIVFTDTQKAWYRANGGWRIAEFVEVVP